MRLIWQRRYLFRSRGARNNHRVAQNPLIRIEEDKLYYSEDIIEEVRSRNDIVDVIGGYVTLKRRGNSYMACCPFHHEKTPSFHVNRDKQMYH